MSRADYSGNNDRVNKLAPTLLALSPPLLRHIFSYLQLDSLRQISLVNRQFQCIIDERMRVINFGAEENCCGPLELLNACQRWPNIRRIDLRFGPRPFDLMSGIRSSGDLGIASLLFSTWMNIQELEIKSCGLGPCSGAALAALGNRWTQLRSIDLHWNKICSEGLIKMSRGSFPCLECLNLCENNIGLDFDEHQDSQVLAALATACPNLHTLDLSGNKITGAMIMPLFMAADFSRLESLKLSDDLIDNEGGVKLGTLILPCLRTLDVSDNYLTDKGVKGICQGNWAELRELNLSWCSLGMEGAQALAKAARKWPHLVKLQLGNSGASHELLEKIFEVHWNSLQCLELNGIHFGDEGALPIAFAWHSGRLPALVELNLVNGRIGANGLRQLFMTTSKEWKLEELELGDETFNEECMHVLASAMKNQLPKLKSLRLWKCDMGPLCLRALMRYPIAHLKELSFIFCDWGTAEALVESVAHLPSLRVLTMICANLSEKDAMCEVVEPLLEAPWASLTHIGIFPFNEDLIKEKIKDIWRIVRNAKPKFGGAVLERNI